MKKDWSEAENCILSFWRFKHFCRTRDPFCYNWENSLNKSWWVLLNPVESFWLLIEAEKQLYTTLELVRTLLTRFFTLIHFNGNGGNKSLQTKLLPALLNLASEDLHANTPTPFLSITSPPLPSCSSRVQRSKWPEKYWGEACCIGQTIRFNRTPNTEHWTNFFQPFHIYHFNSKCNSVSWFCRRLHL